MCRVQCDDDNVCVDNVCVHYSAISHCTAAADFRCVGCSRVLHFVKASGVECGYQQYIIHIAIFFTLVLLLAALITVFVVLRVIDERE